MPFGISRGLRAAMDVAQQAAYPELRLGTAEDAIRVNALRAREGRPLTGFGRSAVNVYRATRMRDQEREREKERKRLGIEGIVERYRTTSFREAARRDDIERGRAADQYPDFGPTYAGPAGEQIRAGIREQQQPDRLGRALTQGDIGGIARETAGAAGQGLSIAGRILDEPLAPGAGPEVGIGPVRFRPLEELSRPSTLFGGAARGISFAPRAGLATRLAAETAASGLGRGAAEALPEDAPGIARLSVGLGAAAAGGLGVARGAGALRGARGVVDDVAEQAIRRAEGPLERSQPGALGRPAPIGGGSPLADVLAELTPNELRSPKATGTGLVRRYEGRTSTYGMAIRRELDQGNQTLKSLDIGKPAPNSRIVDRTPETEALFRALHGEGEVPVRLQPLYDDLKRLIDEETAATLDFDPKFMAHPDYFPRGWRTVEVAPARAGTAQNMGVGAMGARPGFAKPRVDETFSEILSKQYTRPDGSTYRLEPVSWNPYEMAALRKVAGVEFREQQQLVTYLQDAGVGIKADGPLPEGYRVPRVGPAFEGKPRIAPSGEEGAAPQFFGYTDRIAVPNTVANMLENMYGSPLSLGQIDLPFGKSLDVLRTIRTVGQGSKRAKLFGSLFQHTDFARRTGWATFGGAVDDVLSGKPVSAVTKVAKLPAELGKLAYASTSASRRAALRDQILSGKPLFPERPGITLRGVSEAGWSTQDITIIPRDIKTVLQGIEAPPGATRQMIANGTRNIARMEAAMQRGLFDGVYPQAQIIGLKNLILPRLMRQHPDWTDAQIMANAATEVNKMFSTLGIFQSAFKNRAARELMRGLFFSTNESEGLLRGFFSTMGGPNKRLWADFYIGGGLFLGLVANTVHFAATGELLPFDRYAPLERTPYSPIGIGYNRKFLSPNVPLLKGRHGTQIAVDLMGQMDTALRFLDPAAAISGRFSVPVRAFMNQASGTDFYGRPLEGLAERGQQLASDLGVPIGAGNVLGALGIGPENEGRLGVGGQLVQGLGENLLAEDTRALLDSRAQERFGKPFRDLEPVERDQLTEGDARLQAELDARRATSAERGAEGAARSIASEGAQEQRREQQELDDAAVQSGQLSWSQWEDNRAQRNAYLRGQLDTLFAESEEFREEGNPLRKFGELIDANVQPNGLVDWDAVFEAVDAMPAADQAYIERNTGRRRTDLEKQRADVADDLDEAGYFDIGDRTWATIGEQQFFAREVARHDDYYDWYNEKLAQIVQQIRESGYPEGAAIDEARRAMATHPVVQARQELAGILETQFVASNPKLADQAIKFGYFRSTAEEREMLAAYPGLTSRGNQIP